MELESILIEYGKSKNLGKLQLDSSGQCTILINNHYLITFEKSLHKDGFYVYSSIGSIPLGKEQEYSMMALKGNLFGKETGQASIGYVEQNRALVLFEYFDQNIVNYEQFSQRFNQFLRHLFYWITKLESVSQNPSQAPLIDETLPKHVHKKIFYA